MIPNMHHPERGAALITVMLIVSMAAIIAVSMFSRQQIDIQRTSNLLDQGQAYQYAMGAEELARQLLLSDSRLYPGVDHRGESWARFSEKIAIGRGDMAFQLEDLQGRFNVNTLIDGDDTQRIRFEALLASLKLPREIATKLAARVGTRRAPNLLAHISELRQIPGITPEAYDRLLKFVAALPETESALNVNTAPDMVLKAYLPNPADFKRMKAALARRGYLTAGEINAIGMHTKGMTVQSRYFAMMTVATLGSRNVTQYSVLRRRLDARGAASIEVIGRDRSQPVRQVA